MIIDREDIKNVKYAQLHDSLYIIAKAYPSFYSCYMDGDGELALSFDKELSNEEVKDILFELDSIKLTPYSPAPDGPDAMVLKYGRTHVYRDTKLGTKTEVYSPDGYSWRV